MLSILLLTFLATSNALPFPDTEALSSSSTENVEDYELYADLLTLATQMDDEELDKFLEEDVTDDDIQLVSNRGRHKRELPEWARILLKCAAHFLFPKLQLYNVISDVETLFEKGQDTKTIITEVSTKYENMEKENEVEMGQDTKTIITEVSNKYENMEKENEVEMEHTSVEKVKSFFQDRCVQDAIDYGVRNAEKIKCGFKKSVKWAKAKIKNLRESRGWQKVRNFFGRGD